MAKRLARKPVKRSARKLPAKATRRPVAAAAAKPPAQTRYGIIIDGKRTSYTLPSVAAAEAVAVGLREHGHKVAIYDQETNQIVKRR